MQVWAVDVNPLPVAYASFNAQRLGVGDRVSEMCVHSRTRAHTHAFLSASVCLMGRVA
jgi:hypothetical protein